MSEIDLRLCKAATTPQLERLAALAEQPLAPGRFVVAVVDGRIVAALPLAGGPALARSVRADGAPACRCSSCARRSSGSRSHAARSSRATSA